ncbi:TPA: glycosyltransferase family 2 protein, partial [Escherichia coli]|nr:glycosyltransferase family 2 protein [Escherichia coli]
GIIAFFTGKEPTRDKPTRYSALVDSSATYSFAVANNTEDFSQTHPTRK